jgi:alkylation response protein AidB-like acyl-CoA dehydrogenase
MTSSAHVFSAQHSVSADVLDRVATLAVSVDCDSTADRRPVLQELAGDGLLDLGLPGSNGTYLDQVRILAELAGACMTTAFSAWAHRMTVEYLVRHGGDGVAGFTADVRNGVRPGSTAMAATFRAATGQDELTVTLSIDDGGDLRANGFISWASNLYDNAVVVTGMLHDGVRKIVAFEIEQDGVEVLPAEGLLALDASKSGAVRLENVLISESNIFEVEFMDFVKSVRPVFLTFQSAFCVGLAAASLSSIHELSGVGVSLAGPLADRRADLARISNEVEQVALWLDTRDTEIPFHIVRVRLDAAHLATAATQLELAIRGGQAYGAKSPTARRVREALFLPVQSPTEAQLQWELQHFA